KTAMLNKDRGTLESLRAIKSAILLEKTSKAGGELDEAAETAMLQRLIKQRREAADIYKQQNRDDLYAAEMEQAAVIERYMPEQMSAEEVENALREIIAQTGATSMKDMGKVMGMATKQFAGKADNKTVSEMVKKMLS
ncbi:MAG: GatB/YqeY domain-containing protein, partial [Bacteroidales bacterium]|nr:GatB/YqeY domain-containing protein [Bacteroidales bacterium]